MTSPQPTNKSASPAPPSQSANVHASNQKKPAAKANEEEHRVIDEVLIENLSSLRTDFEQGTITSLTPSDVEANKWMDDKKFKKQKAMTKFEIKELVWMEIFRRAKQDSRLSGVNVKIETPGYWKRRWYHLTRDWYQPIADARSKSGRNFYDGKLQLSEEEWEDRIKASPAYKKLRETPFHHFDAMQYILDGQSASGVNAGPRFPRSSGETPSGPSSLQQSRSLSLSPSSVPSGRRAAQDHRAEVVNVSQRWKRLERKRKATEEGDNSEDDHDGSEEDEHEEESQVDKKQKRARRGWPRKKEEEDDLDDDGMARAVLGMQRSMDKYLSKQAQVSNPGSVRLSTIASWLEKREDFEDATKARIMARCLKDEGCAEQVKLLASGCELKLLENAILEEIRSW
ncbi:hypothetical protein L198_04308 [Cryptococcus wingfieldii CBS 7118]|uniref:Uncharacterized protein n=1 Tax=Cryptococcus wingfieldii CBS 7118 TaxID=1295528 RepID=A0A1E3J492_9TREE|nr:hypothetical protein L198_04308 [Cryptococcus wingfieldii CBS 7118]ODN95690.1 hypothetical protein L198_04308 [Cryptococcus wingfieldii CBS 7118]